jgi:hypothetical protein
MNSSAFRLHFQATLPKNRRAKGMREFTQTRIGDLLKSCQRVPSQKAPDARNANIKNEARLQVRGNAEVNEQRRS